MSHVDHILGLMQEAFPPPVNLRGNPRGIGIALAYYRAALEPFDAETLDRAWLKAASENRYRKWPECAEILAAAREIKKGRAAGATKEEWVERALGLADAYVRRFMKGSRAGESARAGGYAGEMKAYVEAVAWVQAQYLVGRKDVAYTSGAIFGRERPDDEFFRRAKAQADSGYIQVRIPHVLIERWRRGAEKGLGR
jgi:hypothetical protein